MKNRERSGIGSAATTSLAFQTHIKLPASWMVIRAARLSSARKTRLRYSLQAGIIKIIFSKRNRLRRAHFLELSGNQQWEVEDNAIAVQQLIPLTSM